MRCWFFSEINMPNLYKSIYGYFDFENIYNHIVTNFPAGNYVEIGTWLGKSTCYMGELIKESGANARMFCVDTFLGEENATDQQEIVKKEGGDIYFRFLANMQDADVLRYMIPLKLRSDQASRLFADHFFQFVFLDAAHLYEDVKLDLNSWWDKLAEGGIFAGHDYYQGTQVKDAVDEFFKERNYKVARSGNCFVVIK